MFVDGYDFKVYNKMGFKSFTDQDTELLKEFKLVVPKLSFRQWFNYAMSFGKVSPIPKDVSFGKVPEGVLRLGGTFVVNGDDIVYQWSDKIPGDHPDIQEVVSVAVESTKMSTSASEEKEDNF
jgi:hypothetical protein